MILIAGDGVCCCCLSCIGLNNMLSEHNVMFECFKMDIQFEGSFDIKSNDNYLICERCVLRLRDAFHFRLQISAAQASIKNGFLNLNNSNCDISLDIKKENILCSENNDKTCDYNEIYINSKVKVDTLNGGENMKMDTDSPRNVNTGGCSVCTKIEEEFKDGIKNNIEFISCEPTVELQDNVSDMEDDIILEKSKLSVKDHEIHIENEFNNDIVKSGKRHTFKCEMCSEKFTSYSRRLIHLKKAHNFEDDNGYHCDYCPEKFHKRNKFEAHINKVHLKDKKVFCDICRKDFTDDQDLRMHLETHKSDLQNLLPLTEIDENFRCNACKKDFSSRPALKEHFKMHYDGKKKFNLYCCAVCRETFPSSFQRVTHMADAHGADVFKYVCSFCPKKFRVNSKLREHVNFAHLKSRRHVCEVCEKAFIDNKSLRIHMVKHTGIKNFQCDMCKRLFATMALLNQHKKSHDNVKNYVCDICAKAFRQSRSLRCHMKLHV